MTGHTVARLGWIGLGAMGGPMAGVAARAGLRRWRTTSIPGGRRRWPAAASRPRRRSPTPPRDADVLVLMVATAEQIEGVLFGDGQALRRCLRRRGDGDGHRRPDRAGAVGPRSPSTTSRSWTPRSRAASRARPGRPARSRDGEAGATRAGGPVLDALAATAAHRPRVPGDGQKVKLVNQLLAGVHIAAAAEALAFAEAMGLEARDARELVRGGAAASFMLDDRGAADGRRRFDDLKQRARHLRQGHGPRVRRGARTQLSLPAGRRPPSSSTGPDAGPDSAGSTTPW